ncbi:hypothetical protein KR215_009312, partial [Drosophila sulfurigaster]
LTECRIKAVNRSFNIVNLKCTVNKKISEFQINFKLLKRERGGWHPFLYDINVDMCDFFKHPYKFMVFTFFYKYVKDYTSMNHTCPYLPNVEIALLNWGINEKEILQKFPVEIGVYAIHTTWYTNKKTFLQINATIVYE